MVDQPVSMALTHGSEFSLLPCPQKIASLSVGTIRSDRLGMVDGVDDPVWIRGGAGGRSDEGGYGQVGAHDSNRTGGH